MRRNESKTYLAIGAAGHLLALRDAPDDAKNRARAGSLAAAVGDNCQSPVVSRLKVTDAIFAELGIE